jgi:hypothetical protein
MKNPIFVPEFREYFSHNKIKDLCWICEENILVIVVEWVYAPTVSTVSNPSILGRLSLQPFEARGCHD